MACPASPNQASSHPEILLYRRLQAEQCKVLHSQYSQPSLMEHISFQELLPSLRWLGTCFWHTGRDQTFILQVACHTTTSSASLHLTSAGTGDRHSPPLASMA